MNSPVKPPAKPGQTAAAGPTAILPIPADGQLYGLQDGEWMPAVPETPSDLNLYVRSGEQKWVIAAAGGVMVTEIVPTMATVGLSAALPAKVYGNGFTSPAQVLWNGAPIPTTWISATELNITIDTTLGVAPSVATVTVQGASGAVGFHFVSSGGQYHFVVGLTHDTATGDVNLQPAGDGPPTLGGVYVIDRVRNNTEGLELGLDGRLRAPLATDSLAGTILEPPPDDKGYVRRRTAAGESAWVPPAGGASTHYVLGLTHDEATGDVNLTPAGWAPEFLGGVYTLGGRSATEGLDLSITGSGQISAPLATPALAGTIVEPPADDKGYVRRTDLAGASAWVPPADTPIPFFGIGLSHDDATLPGTVNLQPAGFGDPKFLGGIYEPPMDGMAYSRQYEVTTNTWEWVPALTAGLQITGLIPDKAVLGGDVVTVHAYGSEFTPTCVLMLDGADIATVYVSPTELTFQMNPKVPTDPISYIVTVRDTAAVPAPGTGLGAEQFEFIVASIQVDYGTGLAFDTTTDPPIVNLQPAQDAANAIGGVYVVDRERNNKEGLELGIDGRLRVPEATDSLLGGILEPPPDDKGYVRRRTAAGESAWVPPADPADTHYALGLSHDDVTGDVNLTPAGWAPELLGGVYTTGGRTHLEGLDLDIAGTGKLSVPLATDLLAGSIVEPPPDDKGYVRRRTPAGESAWVPPADTPLPDFGTGLSIQDGAPGDPQIVHLTPAGLTPELLGGVWVPPRGALQGLEINTAQPGMLVAPPATDTLAGVIVEPPVGPGQLWARTTSAPGTGKWEPVSNIGTLTYRGAWKPATNDPNIHAVPTKVNGDFWIVDCVDPLVAETPPLGSTPGLDGVQLKEGDWVIWNEAAQLWNHIQRTEALTYTIGLIDQRPLGINNINLKPATDIEIGGLYEAPKDGLQYVRQFGQWEKFTSTLQFRIGLTEAGGIVDLKPAAEIEIGGITEPPPDRGFYARTYDGTNGAWAPFDPGSVNYIFGTGLDRTGNRVDLQIAGTAQQIGGVKLVGRSPLQGLEFDLATGLVTAPLATDVVAGSIVEPKPDDKQYARTRTAAGVSSWAEVTASGVTISDTPPVAPGHGDLWWESDSGTMFIWYDDGTSAQWVQTDASPEMPSYGIGIDLEGGAVNLKPANFNGEIGGVKIVGRSPLNGLDYDPATGSLWAPPGTDVLAGTIVDAPSDGKPYARTNDTMNGARWTETSNGAVIISDDPPVVPPTPGALWFDSNAGTLAIWYQDADSSQWVQVNGSQSSGDYLPLTGGTMVGPIVLPSADPTLDTHATHKKYVDTAVATNSLYQSTWQVATNVPDLTVATANPLHGYSWTAVTVNAAVPETAPAGLPGIGGTSIASGDTIKYNATLLIYEHIKTASSAGGIGDAPSDGSEYVRKDATWVNPTAAVVTGFLPLAGGTLTGNLVMSGVTRVDFQNSAYIAKVTANNGLFFHTPGSGVTAFHVSGTGDKLTIASGGVTANTLTANGTLTVNDTLALSSATLTCPEGSKIQFNNTACFIASTSNTRIRYDSGDQHNFFIGVSKFLAVSVNGVEIWGTFTDSFATDLPGSTAADGSVNIGNALVLMMAEIKSLKAEVAALKGAR